MTRDGDSMSNFPTRITSVARHQFAFVGKMDSDMMTRFFSRWKASVRLWKREKSFTFSRDWKSTAASSNLPSRRAVTTNSQSKIDESNSGREDSALPPMILIAQDITGKSFLFRDLDLQLDHIVNGSRKEFVLRAKKKLLRDPEPVALEVERVARQRILEGA